MALFDTLFLIAIVAVAYLLWSLRRFFLSLRRMIHVNTADGTLMTRTLPNLAFAGLFFLVLNQTFLPVLWSHLGLDEFYHDESSIFQQTFYEGKVLAERKPVVYPKFEGLRSMHETLSDFDRSLLTPDPVIKELMLERDLREPKE